MSAIKKVGRPTNAEGERETLKVVNFKADAETLAAIDALARAMRGTGLVNVKSAAIRRAILEAAARLPKTERPKKG